MVTPGVATPESTLIARTRGGDMAAFDELYRQHVDEAVKVARIVCDDRDDVPDLVNEAFTRVLSRLTEGGGPDDDLGPYLRTIVRRLAVDRFHGQRRHTSADPESLEVLPTVDDPIGRAADKHLVRTAFETLPERWQRVLWHTEIEGRSPASLASTLGMAPNSVAALAYRAREGLRQAYLTVNLPRKVAQECRRFNEKLPAYTRGTLPEDSVDVVAEHLTHCTDCRERRDDLLLLASDLRGLLIPALLVPAAGWSLAAAGVAGAAAAGATGGATAASAAGATNGGGILAWMSPAKWGIAATGGSGGAVAGAATGGLAATVAAIAVFTAPFSGDSTPPEVTSDPVAAPSLTVEGPTSAREGATDGLSPARADDESTLGSSTSGDAATDDDPSGPAHDDDDGAKDSDEPRESVTEAPESDPTPDPEPTDPAPDPEPDPDPEPTGPPDTPDPDPTEPDPDPTDPDPDPTEPDPDPEPTDPGPDPDPDPDGDDEALRIDVDLGLGDLLGIDIGIGGILGIGIQ